MKFGKYTLVVFVVGMLIGGLGVHTLVKSRVSRATTVAEGPNASRQWMEYAEDIVRQTKPTPPMSARLYAYVATAYGETLAKTQSPNEASRVTADVLNALVAEYEGTTTAKLASIGGKDVSLSSSANEVEAQLKERIAHDGADAKWDGTRPKGGEYWSGENPFSPLAGSWKRWVIADIDTLSVPPPPKWGSEEQKIALAEVKKVASERTPEQAAAINFWGGVPGTEAPAGIWQNRFFEVTKEYTLSDEEYAKAQMVLAQTLADSFMECWKVKYTYWTRRPSMDDPSIDLAMKNPNFPSYLSGHSTVSRAAAEVLGAFFPEKKDVWLGDATEARNSRLWAGIHFPYDNAEGFSLGEKVGKAVVAHVGVSALR